MLQNFQFKLSEVKINNEVLYTILSAHLIQEGFYDLKGHGEIMILPNQAKYSSFAWFWSLLFERFVHHLQFASQEKCTHLITLLKCFFKIYFIFRYEWILLSCNSKHKNEQKAQKIYFDYFSENKNVRSLLHPKMLHFV